MAASSAASEASVRAFGRVGEHQVEIDQRSTLPEVRLRFEAPDLISSSDLAAHLRATFQIRIEVEKVPDHTLPTFEFKARRWKILT